MPSFEARACAFRSLGHSAAERAAGNPARKHYAQRKPKKPSQKGYTQLTSSVLITDCTSDNGTDTHDVGNTKQNNGLAVVPAAPDLHARRSSLV